MHTTATFPGRCFGMGSLLREKYSLRLLAEQTSLERSRRDRFNFHGGEMRSDEEFVLGATGENRVKNIGSVFSPVTFQESRGIEVIKRHACAPDLLLSGFVEHVRQRCCLHRIVNDSARSIKRQAILSIALLQRRNVGPNFRLAKAMNSLDCGQLFVRRERL